MKSIDSENNNRIIEIDFTKGVLVLFMVLYHGLNYLGYGTLPHVYLNFLPPAFIMITGFIITQVYVPRYGELNDFRNARLVRRALKMILIFIVLNLGVMLFFSRKFTGINIDVGTFFASWIEIFIYGGRRMAAFEILLPISYLLLLSISIVKFQKNFPSLINACAVIVVATCLISELYGSSIYNLNMISAGLIGMAVGLFPLCRINIATNSWTMLIALYATYLFGVFLLGDTYYMQMFATIVTLMIIYAVGKSVDMTQWLSEQVVILGRYSLLSYIIQILFLQITLRMFVYWRIETPGSLLLVISIIVMTWGAVKLLDHARNGFNAIDNIYKLIFA